MRWDIDALWSTSRCVLVCSRLVVSIGTSILLTASVGLNFLPRNVIPLSLYALRDPTLEVSMITLRGVLGSEVLRYGRAMTDLNTGVTKITSIARVITSACEWSVIVVIVNDDGLTHDLLQSLVVVASLSTPLDELLETTWLDFHASAFPITKRAKERIIVSVRVSNPCDYGKLHASGEWDVNSTANTLRVFRPRVGDNRIKIKLWDFGEQLLDRCTNLFRRLFVSLHSVVVETHLCKGLGHNAIVLLLLQIVACNEGTLVRKVS